MIELVRGFLPLLRPGSIYLAEQDLAMELAADWSLCRELLYSKHSSLAHQKESGQSNSEVQDSVAWGSEVTVGTADPGNLVYHRCSKVAPHLRHRCQVLHEEQELPDGTFSQLCWKISYTIWYTIWYTISYTISPFSITACHIVGQKWPTTS